MFGLPAALSMRADFNSKSMAITLLPALSLSGRLLIVKVAERV